MNATVGWWLLALSSWTAYCVLWHDKVWRSFDEDYNGMTTQENKEWDAYVRSWKHTGWRHMPVTGWYDPKGRMVDND